MSDDPQHVEPAAADAVAAAAVNPNPNVVNAAADGEEQLDLANRVHRSGAHYRAPPTPAPSTSAINPRPRPAYRRRRTSEPPPNAPNDADIETLRDMALDAERRKNHRDSSSSNLSEYFDSAPTTATHHVFNRAGFFGATHARQFMAADGDDTNNQNTNRL